MKRLALLLIVLLLPTGAGACFGPKLHVGIAADSGSRVLAALVILYVKEKTGVESQSTELPTTAAGTELAADRIDLAVAAAGLPAEHRLFELPGGAALAIGPRPREDIRFTTVVPALEKLAGLLTASDFKTLLAAVAAGATPAAAARQFLQERRWI